MTLYTYKIILLLWLWLDYVKCTHVHTVVGDKCITQFLAGSCLCDIALHISYNFIHFLQLQLTTKKRVLLFCNVCTGIILVAVSLLYLFNSKPYHTCDNCGINHDNIILPLTCREKPSHVSSALQFQSTYYYDHVNSTTATFQQTTTSHDINPSTVHDIKLSDVHDIKPTNVRDINPSGVHHIDPVARQRSRNIKSFHIHKYSKMMETC